MDRNKFKELIIGYFKKYNLQISQKEADLFYLYMNNLLEWNSKINLTAIQREEEIIIKHFLDSSIISNYIKEGKIIDIGSGAGFPGIPIKIINEKLEIKMIDSVGKKIRFLDDTIIKLGLNKIEAIHCRAEELAHKKENRESYDYAISRAVANMSTLVEYMIPFLKIGGKCFCMKGPSVGEEINEARNAIKKLGGKITDIIKYNVEGNERSIVIILKEKNTEQTYPRKTGKPLKEPLK